MLKSDEYAQFVGSPARLRRMVAAASDRLCILDEIQKIPALLDEVHWLIEEQGTHFILCGSSARKLKRGGGNLLGGRARRYELFGLVRAELASLFDLKRLINYGNLPPHFLSDDLESDLEAYVGDYLKEEIAAEALVRNLTRFSDFLRAAAVCDTEVVDYTKVASECGVSGATASNHHSILEDTLLGYFLPAYVSRQLKPGSELFGKAFENWLMHEIRSYNQTPQRTARVSH